MAKNKSPTEDSRPYDIEAVVRELAANADLTRAARDHLTWLDIKLTATDPKSGTVTTEMVAYGTMIRKTIKCRDGHDWGPTMVAFFDFVIDCMVEAPLRAIEPVYKLGKALVEPPRKSRR